MATYASGKFSVGACMRCGLMFPYQDIRDDGDVKGLRVCHECFQEEHPQERPKRPRDPIALRKPSPENIPATPSGPPAEVVFPIYLVDLGTYFGQNLAQWQIGQPSNNPSDTGTISLSSSTYTMDTGETSVVVTAVRSGSFMGSTYATYTVTDAHGVVVPVPPGQFVWADGDSANKTLTLTRAQNCAYDVTVTLSDPAPLSSLGSPSSATVSVAYDHSIAATDPHFSSVVSLLHFNGADGATTTTDQKGKAWAFNGNAQIDTAQSKFGGSSLLLDGNGDYLETPDHADFEFGAGDFTIEAWVRLPSLPASAGFIASKDYADSTRGWRVFVSTAGIFGGSIREPGFGVNATTPLTVGVWGHVAFVRYGDRLMSFFNGQLEGELNAAGYLIPDATSLPKIGVNGDLGGPQSGTYFNGWIDDLRITKGVARYTCNFTPPSNQFRDS